MDSILTELGFGPMDDEDLRVFLSKCFSKSKKVMEAILLPQEVKDVIDLIKTDSIPLNFGSLPISGDDIMETTGLKPGPKIGEIQRTMLKDALMFRFNWRDRESCLKHLINYIQLDHHLFDI